MNVTPAAPPTPAVSQDVNALASIIPLDPQPVAVSWQRKALGSNHVVDIPGPTDYSLTAVLQYRDEDVAAVVAAAAKMAPAAIGEVAWQDWFPAALKPFATPSQDGNLVLKGERYQSHQIKRAPLLQGPLVRIGKTNYFVLSLFTM
jgi:hypothetical protein